MRTGERVFLGICILSVFTGFYLPGLSKFIGLLLVFLLMYWVASVLIYTTNKNVFDKRAEGHPILRFLPNLKLAMFGQDSVQKLIPAWIFVALLAFMQFLPVILLHVL